MATEPLALHNGRVDQVDIAKTSKASIASKMGAVKCSKTTTFLSNRPKTWSMLAQPQLRTAISILCLCTISSQIIWVRLFLCNIFPGSLFAFDREERRLHSTSLGLHKYKPKGYPCSKDEDFENENFSLLIACRVVEVFCESPRN